MYWYLLGLAIGLYMMWGGATKSSAKPYYYLHARASLLWKDRAHQLFMISGFVVAVVMLSLALTQ